MMTSRFGYAGMVSNESKAMLESRLRSALVKVLRYKDSRHEFPRAYKAALDELVDVRLTMKDLEQLASVRKAA